MLQEQRSSYNRLVASAGVETTTMSAPAKRQLFEIQRLVETSLAAIDELSEDLIQRILDLVKTNPEWIEVSTISNKRVRSGLFNQLVMLSLTAATGAIGRACENDELIAEFKQGLENCDWIRSVLAHDQHRKLISNLS